MMTTQSKSAPGRKSNASPKPKPKRVYGKAISVTGNKIQKPEPPKKPEPQNIELA